MLATTYRENMMLRNRLASTSIFFGTRDDDHIKGTGGNDVIVDLSGDDAVFGGDGDDTFISSRGNDEFHGGDGDDTFVFFPRSFDGAGIGRDIWVDGGDGFDTFEFNRSDRDFTLRGHDDILVLYFRENDMRIVFHDMDRIDFKNASWDV